MLSAPTFCGQWVYFGERPANSSLTLCVQSADIIWLTINRKFIVYNCQKTIYKEYSK